MSGTWDARPSEPEPTSPLEPEPTSLYPSAPPLAPDAADPYPPQPPAAPTWPFPADSQPERPASPRRRRPGRTILLLIGAVAVAVSGFGLGVALSDDDTPGQATDAPIAAPRGDVETDPANRPTEPPVDGGSDEPVAEVAAALAPAIVQLERDGGLGSGIIYDPNGLVLTANHVIDGAGEVTVRLADGRQLRGRVVGGDQASDVGVVQIEGAGDLPVAVLGVDIDVRVGQLAVAIGSPFGLDQSVTAGIVSAVNRAVPTEDGIITMLQTDAPINPGNSGGALADRQGRVIGINDAIRTNSGGNEGVGFAIPIATAVDIADRLVAGLPVETAFLGVSMEDASGEQAGAVVTGVEPGTPAAEAGIQVGDLVVALDGDRVQSNVDLAAGVRSRRPGDTVTITVVRNGADLELRATLTTNTN